MSCPCDVCKLSRRARRTLSSGSRPALRRMVGELLQKLWDAEFEAEMSRSLLARQLEDALTKLAERPYLAG